VRMYSRKAISCWSRVHAIRSAMGVLCRCKSRMYLESGRSPGIPRPINSPAPSRIAPVSFHPSNDPQTPHR
jgi:hypothetical protein